MMVMVFWIGSEAVLHHFNQALWTSGEKKWRERGQREKEGTRRRRWRFERREGTLCRGRFGCPEFFLPAENWMRESEGMWVVMWGFCHAHLGLLVMFFGMLKIWYGRNLL